MRKTKQPTGTCNDGWRLPPDEVLFGCSIPMQAIRQLVSKVAVTTVTILIEGPNGTGKEWLARRIHSQSGLKGPFVKLNCAAIPGALLESELFGYEKGAFTGAVQQKPGLVEHASSGTLFLDEVTEIEPGLQAKLLQFLQDGHFFRIGGDQEEFVNTRLICSTRHKLENEIEMGKFRADLFYRINVVRIEMPRLSERRDDIAKIAHYMLAQFNLQFERSAEPFPRRLIHEMEGYPWPGNIRELENRVARYVLLGDESAERGDSTKRGILHPALPGTANAPIQPKPSSQKTRLELGREVILQALKANQWNRKRTAEELKISYRTLLYRIREAGLSSKRSGDRQLRKFEATPNSTLLGD